MSVHSRWEPTEEEQHQTTLRLQKVERDLRCLMAQDRVWADLCVMHFELQPEAISELLGLEPDSVTRMDDCITPEGRFDFRSDRTFWILSSADKIRNSEASLHLEWIIQQIAGRLPALQRLSSTGGEIELRVRAEKWSHYESLEIEPATLLFLGRYGIRLAVGTRMRTKGDGL
ncbi:MAG: DUF4279 domain-containing protein [Candidatus Obscuribacterales bacterium]|nr:DUF4279 domain-containing protein [Candidatus Obscuribacterales bacterium]